jgi:flagellar biosynthetic protein FlhB
METYRTIEDEQAGSQGRTPRHGRGPGNQNQDPAKTKTKIRQKQFQAAMQRMLQDVPTANVVLVNPTHVAVALRYDPGTMQTPIVVAKGGDHMCEKIKEIARANGVPIIRRPALARELHGTVKLGESIPEKLFTAVAEVLALLYRIRHNS